MRKLSKRAEAYLRIIGQMDGAYVNLTRGFTKAAQKIKDAGLAIYIFQARGGCHVALTRAGIDYYEELTR